MWVFAPHRNVLVQDNVITNVSVGLAAAGQGADVTTSFVHNTVDAQHRAGSVGAYVTTSLFGWGSANVSASFTGGNVIENADDGIYIEQETGYIATAGIIGNTITGNAIGVNVNGGTATISGNHIYGNAGSAMTLSDLYATEDKIVHAVDQSGLGFVRVNADNVYVTPNSHVGAGTASIGRAVAVAGADDTVNVQGGSYVEPSQIVIDKNLTIVGTDGMPATTDSVGFNTTNSGDGKGWYVVTDGTTFNLSGLTLDGSGHRVFQAIRDYGSGTIDHVAFNNIQFNASGGDYAGTGVVAFGTYSVVNVTNSTFSGMGREGVLFYGSGTTGTFTGNTYTGKGAGDWLDYAVEVGAGAHATISGNTITGNIGAASVDGSTSAGILVTTYFGGGTQAEISDNHIYGNSTGIAVGYDASDTSYVDAHDNVFHGSGGNVTGIAVVGGSAKIQDNDLTGQTVGITVSGNALIDAGGGSLGSVGNNDLTGYTGVGGNYAIEDLNLSAGGGRDVMARNNNFGPYVARR